MSLYSTGTRHMFRNLKKKLGSREIYYDAFENLWRVTRNIDTALKKFKLDDHAEPPPFWRLRLQVS